MKQTLFSQIEHDKEDILRLSNTLFEFDDFDKSFEELKALANNHMLTYNHVHKDGSHLFNAAVNGINEKFCALIATIEASDNCIVKWEQSMILSMCMAVMLSLNSCASSLPFSLKLFIVTKDEEMSLVSQRLIKDAKYCVFFNWGNETRNSLTSSAVMKNTFVFNSKTIPLGKEEYYGNPILCLSALSAFCSDISSCLSKGAAIRLLVNNIEKNNSFHVTSLTIESYTITADPSLAEDISLIISETAKMIAKSCIVSLEDESRNFIEMPFRSDEKINIIFMHAFKEHGFIEPRCAKSMPNGISSAQISYEIPSIHPCLGLTGTTKEDDINHRKKEHTISELAAASLICAAKAVVSAICDIFQINGN